MTAAVKQGFQKGSFFHLGASVCTGEPLKADQFSISRSQILLRLLSHCKCMYEHIFVTALNLFTLICQNFSLS